MLVREAIIRIPQDQLLSALWHSDGSGAHGISVGIDTVSDDWEIHAVSVRTGGIVEIQIRYRPE